MGRRFKLAIIAPAFVLVILVVLVCLCSVRPFRRWGGATIILMDRVGCPAFRKEYDFYRGFEATRGIEMLLPESYLRLVVKNGKARVVGRRTALVGLVHVETGEQALALVRLFSREETHYLFGFHGTDFLELPRYEVGSLYWQDEDSVLRAREAGIPIDDPPVQITKTGDSFRVSRFVIDWGHNVYRVVETVGRDGEYGVEAKKLLATGIRVPMPVYRWPRKSPTEYPVLLDRIYCSALKKEYLFYRGIPYGGAASPLESCLRLVVVKDGVWEPVDDPTHLVGLAQVKTAQQALDFVRLFSRAETHYLFGSHASDFLELPKYDVGSQYWACADSVLRARKLGIPIDDPPVEIAKTGDSFCVTRYVIDWDGRVSRVVESVGKDGTYRVESRTLIAEGVPLVMPSYR